MSPAPPPPSSLPAEVKVTTGDIITDAFHARLFLGGEPWSVDCGHNHARPDLAARCLRKVAERWARTVGRLDGEELLTAEGHGRLAGAMWELTTFREVDSPILGRRLQESRGRVYPLAAAGLTVEEAQP